MNINKLPTIIKHAKKRLGRGHGSGRGKTSGRGTKGQKARETIRLGFEGGQLPIIKRLPFLRGKGKNTVTQRKPLAIRVDRFNSFTKGTMVTLAILKKQGMIKDTVRNVKIVNGGKLTVALTVFLPVTRGAKVAIENSGGKVQIP